MPPRSIPKQTPQPDSTLHAAPGLRARESSKAYYKGWLKRVYDKDYYKGYFTGCYQGCYSASYKLYFEGFWLKPCKARRTLSWSHDQPQIKLNPAKEPQAFPSHNPAPEVGKVGFREFAKVAGFGSRVLAVED